MRILFVAAGVFAAMQIPSSARADFWKHEGKDGTITFTNIPPSGKSWNRDWKVMFRTGPDKASALRGATDLRPPRDGSPDRFHRYDAAIHDQFEHYHIPETLIRAVIKTESDFDPNVISSAGARGLMQLMPGTAGLMGVTNPFDPRQNVFGGARYLQTLVQQFCHTPHNTAATQLVCTSKEEIKVIAAYHAGPGAVLKYGGMPPYQTTKDYVRMVLTRWYQNEMRPGRLVAER